MEAFADFLKACMQFFLIKIPLTDFTVLHLTVFIIIMNIVISLFRSLMSSESGNASAGRMKREKVKGEKSK